MRRMSDQWKFTISKVFFSSAKCKTNDDNILFLSSDVKQSWKVQDDDIDISNDHFCNYVYDNYSIKSQAILNLIKVLKKYII